MILGKSEKINVFIFYCGVRTGHFGVGAHMGLLLPAIKADRNIDLRMIRTDDINAEYVIEYEEEGVPVFCIPQPENKLYITSENSVIQQTYASRIVEITAPFIQRSGAGRPIFFVNSADYLNVVRVLKEKFDCAIVYVHHSWGWKTVSNIPDEDFARYYLAEGNANPLKNRLASFVQYQKEMAEESDAAITVTKQALHFFRDILGLPDHQLKCIYNGIDFDLPDAKDRDMLKEELGFARTDKLVLFSGRIREDKGLLFLIRAFKLVAASDPTVRLILAGGGDYQKFIPETAPFWARVTFTGQVSKEILRKLYSIADIGVLPSLHEQCSFTALEMRYHRLPAIVSSVDGLDEMYQHEFDALKLDVHLDGKGEKVLDERQLASFIEVLLKNSQLAGKLSENAFEKGKDLYDIKKMCGEYIAVFKNLAGNIESN